jgi:hypothetical protein
VPKDLEKKKPKVKASKASVGRIVHYLGCDSSDCLAAIITRVQSPSEIDLLVVTTDGLYFRKGCYLSEDLNKPAGSWHWPETV